MVLLMNVVNQLTLKMNKVFFFFFFFKLKSRR